MTDPHPTIFTLAHEGDGGPPRKPMLYTDISPAQIAGWFLAVNLRTVLALQTILAEHGVSLNLQTAEVQLVDPR